MSTTEHHETPIDLEHLRTWVGRVVEAQDLISVRHAKLMAASLGLPQSACFDGAALPPLWHWLYFLEGLPPAELGRDGHPSRGGFLPPVPLANRMWAGGQLEFHRPLLMGETALKRSWVKSVDHKQGRSGHLVFVTVRHELFSGDRLAIREDHDIVYKPPTPPGAARPAVHVDLPQPTHSEPFEATSTLLFRYSALTFNGHRIHYDQDYCREVEGYANLVVHGPLQATLLAGLARRLAPSPIKAFRYRALQPNLLGTPLSLNAAQMEHSISLWSALPGGSPSMQAEAHC